MLKSIIRLIKQAKENGISLNSFCAKQNAKRSALRSMIFKLWRKIFVKNKVIVKIVSDKLDFIIVEIVKHPKLSAGSYHALSYLTLDAKINGYNVVVL